jgi:hypothetical protein
MAKSSDPTSSYEALRNSLTQGEGEAMHGVNTGFKKTRGTRRSKAVKLSPEQVVREESEIYKLKDTVEDFKSAEQLATNTTNKSFWRKIFG